eukprot:TRINITY_DN1064_c0_g1_i1.p1 TRINITY_DN1064_c0_g1~~TRINITY_DN1064_c0_g1_i1.p1  ORF type:complete len:745 (+),score=188.64 TRINITY_DN1064_c0_g1_i1:83-2317(+)
MSSHQSPSRTGGYESTVATRRVATRASVPRSVSRSNADVVAAQSHRAAMAGRQHGAAVDLLTSNITVTSVELAERERQTNMMRQQLSALGKERAMLQKGLTEAKAYASRLEAKLTAGGLTAAYAKLDSKNRLQKKKLADVQAALRGSESAAAELESEVRVLTAALELRAEDLGARSADLIDVARGGEILERYEAKLSDKDHILRQYRTENESQSVTVAQLEKRVAELEEDVALRAEKHKILEQWAQMLNAQNEETRERQAALEEAASAARSKEEAAKRDAAAASADFGSREAELAGELSAAKAREERLNARVRELEVWQEVQDGQLSELKSKNADLTERLRGVEEVPGLADALQRQTQESHALREHMRREEEALRAAELRSSDDATQNMELRKQVTELLARLERAQDEAAGLRSSQAVQVQLQNDFSALQQRYAQLTQDANEWQRRAETAEPQVRTLTQKCQRLEAAIKQKDAEVRRLQLLSDARTSCSEHGEKPSTRRGSAAAGEAAYGVLESLSGGQGRVSRSTAAIFLESEPRLTQMLAAYEVAALTRTLKRTAEEEAGALLCDEWLRLLSLHRRHAVVAVPALAAATAPPPPPPPQAESRPQAPPDRPVRSGFEPAPEISPAVAAAFVMATTPSPRARALPGASGPVPAASPLQHSLTLSSDAPSPVQPHPLPQTAAEQAEHIGEGPEDWLEGGAPAGAAQADAVLGEDVGPDEDTIPTGGHAGRSERLSTLENLAYHYH